MRTPVTFAAILAVLLIAFAAYAHHGPDTVTIGAAAAKQPPVTFNHAKHASTLVKSCDTCHHTQKGLKTDKDTKVEKCTSCHLDPKSGVPSMREASLQTNPFHNKLCISCHREQKKGPTVCTGCHVKKS